MLTLSIISGIISAYLLIKFGWPMIKWLFILGLIIVVVRCIN